jgi:hypothetical protein
VAIVLKSVGSVLYEIFAVFFKNEIRGGNNITEEVLSKSAEKSVFEFCREYDLCPSLINKSQAYKIYL